MTGYKGSKRSALQRQASEKMQARAAATIPIHRESLVNLRNSISIAPNTSGTMANATNVHVRPEAGPSDRGKSGPCKTNHVLPPVDPWETKFCVEPPGDVATCMLGTLVPCALYGKVNWRLDRMAMEEEATSDDWRSNEGCNGPCMGYYASSLVCGCGFGYGLLSGRAPVHVPR